MKDSQNLPEVFHHDDETFDERKPRYYKPIKNLFLKGSFDYCLRTLVSCSDLLLGRRMVLSSKRYHGGDVHQKRHRSLYGLLSRYDRVCDFYRRPSQRNKDYGLDYSEFDSLRKQFSYSYGKFFPKEILMRSLNFCISRYCADIEMNRGTKTQTEKIYHRPVLKDIEASRSFYEKSGLSYQDTKGMTLDQIQKAQALKEQMDKEVARKAYWASRGKKPQKSQSSKGFSKKTRKVKSLGHER